MKEVINITLGNVVFAVEKDAYEALSLYLGQIKNNLHNNGDIEEIISDVEGAIAEKFISNGRSEKIAVTSADVEAVVLEMGEPSDFNEDIDEAASDDDSKNPDTKKKLYRDPDDVLIAGVASGLAKYFGFDAVLVRLAFVIFTFFNGLGIFVYLVLWLIVPMASTTKDKYAMRGERVTLKEITDRVGKNIKSIDTTDYVVGRGLWDNLRNILDKLFRVMSTVAKSFVSILRIAIGALVILVGALSTAAAASVFSILLFSDKSFFPEEASRALSMLQGSSLGIVSMISCFMAISILSVFIIIAGTSIAVKRNLFTVRKTVVLAAVWIIFTVMAVSTTALQIMKIRDEYNTDSVDQLSLNSEIEQAF